jgi:ribonuclease HII
VDSNWIIGVDEAGRGPVIGPLVVAALAIPADDIEILSKLNVKDSKDISSNERLRIFTEINQRIEDEKWKSGLIFCSPKRIDINSVASDLNRLEIDLFSEAIFATDLSSDSGVIRADACDVNENRFKIRLQASLGEDWGAWRIDAEHGMDSKDLVTGGASILAKVSRDSAIQEIAARTGIEIGSGYPSDKTTRSAVEKMLSNGKPHDSLRWSWATVSDIWQNLHRTPVPVRTQQGGPVVQSSLDDW